MAAGYTKETYQLGVINIEIGNEEEGHALVKEAQEIYKMLYGEIPAIMERNRQRDREYLESNGITLSEEPPKQLDSNSSCAHVNATCITRTLSCSQTISFPCPIRHFRV